MCDGFADHVLEHIFEVNKISEKNLTVKDFQQTEALIGVSRSFVKVALKFGYRWVNLRIVTRKKPSESESFFSSFYGNTNFDYFIQFSNGVKKTWLEKMVLRD